MMTQLQGVLQADEQTIAQLELERDIAAQADEIAPEKIVNFYYEELGDSTEQILRYAFWLADVKENSSKSRYQQIIKEQGVNFCPANDVQEWKLGWQEGTSVVANSTSQHFEQWCRGQKVRIVSVCGEVGKIQFVQVVRDDGETYDSFGDWIAEAPVAINVQRRQCWG